MSESERVCAGDDSERRKRQALLHHPKDQALWHARHMLLPSRMGWASVLFGLDPRGLGRRVQVCYTVPVHSRDMSASRHTASSSDDQISDGDHVFEDWHKEGDWNARELLVVAGGMPVLWYPGGSYSRRKRETGGERELR